MPVDTEEHFRNRLIELLGKLLDSHLKLASDHNVIRDKITLIEEHLAKIAKYK